MTRRSSLLMAAVLALCLVANRASAQWVPDGTPICIEPGRQDGQVIVPDGSGGAIIAWQDARNPDDVLGGDIYAQRVTADGAIAPGWTPNGVPVCTVLGDESVLDMISDGAGGAIIVWRDYRQGSSTAHDIYAQRITAAGTVAPGWPANGVPVCIAIYDQHFPRLCSDGAGGAIIAWMDPRNSTDSAVFDVYAQRLIADGAVAPGWPANGTRITSSSTVVTTDPRITSDGAGGAIIVWDNGSIVAERVTGAGTLAPGWNAGGNAVASLTIGGAAPMIASDGAEGAFIAWHDATITGAGLDWDVFVQRIAGVGLIPPGWPANGVRACGAPGDQAGHSLRGGGDLGPPVIPDGSGGVVVTWEDGRNGVDVDIYAQRITASGAIVPGWASDGNPVVRMADRQDLPELTRDGAGGAYFCWRDRRSGTNDDIYAQHLTAEGAVAPWWPADGSPVCTAPGDQYTPTIESGGEPGAILTWYDYRADPVNYVDADIYAQHLVDDAPVGIEVSVGKADAVPGEVRLTWFVTGGLSFEATILRSRGAAWESLGVVSPDGTGRIAYSDHDVQPGGRYGYRLRLSGSVDQKFAGEVWVEVPRAVSFSLAGLRPNPSAAEWLVSFTLPDNSSAVLEVFDLGGRSLMRRVVGSLGAGSHVLNLRETAHLGSGVYLVRLTRGAQSFSARGVIIR